MGNPKGFMPPAAGMGRIKGSKNKAPRELKDMILHALSAVGGQHYLERQAELEARHSLELTQPISLLLGTKAVTYHYE